MTSIYLIASERSGTNLVRREFTNAQTDFYGMSPAHLLKNLYFREPFYGDLSQDNAFLNYIQDALNLCTIHFAPWEINWTPQGILKDYKNTPRTSIFFADYLMKKYAQEKGFNSYFCKDNYIYEFANDIATKLPDAKFIYLYRDPRDVILSQIKRAKAKGSANINVRYFARMWNYEQIRSIRAAHALEQDNKCLRFSYEAFLENPEAITKNICHHTNVQYTPSETALEKNDGDIHEWKNLSKPVDTDNKNKFLTGLSKSDIRLIETECFDTMTYLGYSPLFGKNSATKMDRITNKIKNITYSYKHKILHRNTNKNTNPAIPARAKFLKTLTVNYTNRG